MDISYFDSLVKKTREKENQEQLWDEKAIEFNKNISKSKASKVDGLISLLKGRNIINSSSEILDIGCGPGRHSMEFAKESQSVIGLDISSKMLEFAIKNNKDDNFSKTSYIKANWADLDLMEFGWEKRFDFIFSSMCPAVDVKEALEKMSKASKGYCMVSRMIKRQDNISDEIMNKFNIDNSKDPHNSRETLWAFLNMIWLMGYNPEIAYLESKDTFKLTKEESISRHISRFSKHNLEKEIKDFFNNIKDEMISYKTYSNSALLYWKA